MLKIIFCITILSTSSLFCAARSFNPENEPVISAPQFHDYFGDVKTSDSEENYYRTFVTKQKKLLTILNPDAQNKNIRIKAREYILTMCELQLTKQQFDTLHQKIKTCIAQELFIEMIHSRRQATNSESWSARNNTLPSNIEGHFKGLSVQNFIDHNFPILNYPVAIAPEYQFSRCKARLNNLRLSSLDGLRNIPGIEECDTIVLDNNALRKIPPYAFSNFRILQKVFLRNNPGALSPLCFVKKHNEHEIQDVFLPLIGFEFLLPGILITDLRPAVLTTNPYVLTADHKEIIACEAIKDQLKAWMPIFGVENSARRLGSLFITHKQAAAQTKQSVKKEAVRKKKNSKVSASRRIR